MSQRPRLAGDGLLLVPAEVSRDQASYTIRARFAGDMRDPFGWTEDRLLLAESFARLDPHRFTDWVPWFGRHGVIDTGSMPGLVVDLGRDFPLAEPPQSVEDDDTDIVREFITVNWHVGLLTLLSEHRADRVWDPVWGQVVLDGAGEGRIIGGPHAGKLVTDACFWATNRESLAADPKRRAFHDEQVELHAATDGWPRIVVYDSMWTDVRLGAPDGRDWSAVREAERRASVLGTTWDEAVELLRLTIEPRVQRAVERRFTTERVADGSDDAERRVLVPREMRIWRSILSPIYLQLFESLRRITEGEPGAAICRECGQPFLVLDARRRFFCNDRERFRHAQRERRKRLSLSVEDSVTFSDSVTAEITRGAKTQ